MPEEEYLGGLIIEDISPDDWLFGGKEHPVILPGGDWRPYKPNPELQATKKFDPYSCVSESGPDNAVSELLNLMMERDPNVKPILEKFRMLDDNGKANLSARFVAVGSGTIPGRGNSQKAVYEFVRKNGLVGEKVWPSKPEMSEDEYFNKVNGVPTIPAEVRKAGLEFLEYFDFNWERIGDGVNFTKDEMKQATEKGPVVVCVGGAYLGKYLGAMLYRNDGPVNYNHQINYLEQERDVIITGEQFDFISHIFDTYNPVDKDFAPTYPFKYGIVHYLTLKKKLPNMTQVVRQTGQRNCYLYVPELDIYSPIEDSQPITSPVNGVTAVVAGGDIVKPFSGGKYPNIPEVNIPQEKIFGRVKITL